jgi:hypothetical protein
MWLVNGIGGPNFSLFFVTPTPHTPNTCLLKFETYLVRGIMNHEQIQRLKIENKTKLQPRAKINRISRHPDCSCSQFGLVAV